jgi:HK97 family phage portal protein
MLTQYLQKILPIRKERKSNDYLNFQSLYSVNDAPATGANSYTQNVIVYRCVNLISQTASHVPWQVFIHRAGKKNLSNNHSISALLKKPNINKGGAEFFAELIASKLLFGNAYILGVAIDNASPKALYLLPSQNTNVEIQNGKAIAYKCNVNNTSKLYPIHAISCMSKVLHIKSYNPKNPILGLSALEAAAASIEVHTMASKWNSGLLKNGARPSGALVMKDPNSYLTDEQFERLKEQLYSKYAGSGNSGKPMILEGGLDWREMSISPKDMDFIESKNSAAREIALAFGVPPQLLGINGDNTYSNMQEARIALWEETLIPLLDKLSDSLTNWLSYWFNEDIVVDFDRDAISALTEKRENLWGKISESNFMTVNEKRAFVGLGPIKGGDVIDMVKS